MIVNLSGCKRAPEEMLGFSVGSHSALRQREIGEYEGEVVMRVALLRAEDVRGPGQ